MLMLTNAQCSDIVLLDQQIPPHIQLRYNDIGTGENLYSHSPAALQRGCRKWGDMVILLLENSK